MSNAVRVSQSRIKSRRQCHEQHYLKYTEKLRRKKIKRPFMFGRIVHSMHEAVAEGDDPFAVLQAIDLQNAKLFRREVEMYGDIIADIELIFREYQTFWPDDSIQYMRRDKRSSEWKFELPLEDGLIIEGRVDTVVKTKKTKGMRWLTEHKTFSKYPSEEERWKSVQSTVYGRAIEMLGWWTIDGTMWNYIKSKSPTTPQLLKNGTMSVRQLDTLPSRVLAFLQSQGLNPKDKKYREFLNTAEENRANYFIRRFNPTKKNVVDKIWDDALATAREIRDEAEKPNPSRVRNIDRHCDWCDFRDLCAIEITGGDVDFLKSREYTVQEEAPLFDEDADRNED